MKMGDLFDDSTLIILKVDKGIGRVLLDKNDYDDKRGSFLDKSIEFIEAEFLNSS